MNENLKAFLKYLVFNRCIGGKHTSESRLFRFKLRNLRPKERREFDKEYREIINKGFVIRLKKRTGAEDDWHVSLNPAKVNELINEIKFEEPDEGSSEQDD